MPLAPSGKHELHLDELAADSMIRRRVVAHGQVQGVFFRDSVSRRAAGLGVAGWVLNRRDGAVEAVFEGNADAVDSMVRACREGPGRAEVTELEVFEEEPEGLDDFRVRSG